VILTLLADAEIGGARLVQACRVVGVSARTIQRRRRLAKDWRKGDLRVRLPSLLPITTCDSALRRGASLPLRFARPPSSVAIEGAAVGPGLVTNVAVVV